MDESPPRPPVLPAGPASRLPEPVRHLAAPLAGVSGCLLLAVGTFPGQGFGQPPYLGAPVHATLYGDGLLWLVVAIGAVAGGLLLPRWWPYLLVAGGLTTVPGVLGVLVELAVPIRVREACHAGFPLAVIGVLACVQSLSRRSASRGAAVAGLAIGLPLAVTSVGGAVWLSVPDTYPKLRAGMALVGLLGLGPAVYRYRRGDPAATGHPGAGLGPRQRISLVIAGGLAVLVQALLSLLGTAQLSALLGVTVSALYRHGLAQSAVIGAATLVAVVVLATLAGPWSLAGALTVATVQVAVAAPLTLALVALDQQQPLRWLGALVGVVLGVLLVGTRWRVPLAAGTAVVSATALFIAYAATTGHPEKLAEQHRTVPAVLLLIAVTAAATTVIGATVPVLSPRGVLPAAAGPLAGVLAAAGAATVSVTYVRDGEPQSSYLNPVYHLTTSALLLLVAGAAIGGLGFAQVLAVRRAERKHAEQIRREAAAAERDRLARPIHDGVLQVLALVQRHGAELGGQGAQLAALAGEQEAALRTLLSGGSTARGQSREDLRMSLRVLACATVEVTAPAEPVVLPAPTVGELTAAVQAALDNVRRHAGPGARAWILVEDEGDGVRVTVRDDGAGFPPERLVEAAGAGRLGVAQSMRGRITDLGGTTEIFSRPGEGTEVEFWVPRKRPAGRG